MPKRSGRPVRDTRQVVGRAAEAAPGQGSDTTQSSEWLAERERPADPPPGIPLDTDRRPDARDAPRESRRGSHRSG
jgi:hypothetical protein